MCMKAHDPWWIDLTWVRLMLANLIWVALSGMALNAMILWPQINLVAQIFVMCAAGLVTVVLSLALLNLDWLDSR
jgi:hypothetical protein